LLGLQSKGENMSILVNQAYLEQACENKIRESLTILGFDHLYVEVRFDLRGHKAGEALSCPNVAHLIRINRELLYKHGQEYLDRTPGHEVCHIVQTETHPRDKQKHGRVWQIYMRKLGITPSRCHIYDSKPSRVFKTYEFACGCSSKVHNMTRVRIRKMVRAEGARYYKCMSCGHRLLPLARAKTRLIIEKNNLRREAEKQAEKQAGKIFLEKG